MRGSECGRLRGDRGAVTGRGAPLPSRLPGPGSRPGRSAGPGRLSSFLRCDPGVRPAPPPTTAEAEAVAESAAAAAAPRRIRSWSQAGRIRSGLPQWPFACSTAGRHSDSGGWVGIGGFRPSGRKQAPVSGRSGLAVTPRPPRASSRPAPRRPRPARRSPGRGQFGACPARDPLFSWPVFPKPLVWRVLEPELQGGRGHS